MRVRQFPSEGETIRESNVHILELLHPGPTSPTRIYLVRKLCCGDTLVMTYQQIVSRRRRKTHQCAKCRDRSEEQRKRGKEKAKEATERFAFALRLPSLAEPKRDNAPGLTWGEDFRFRNGPWRRHAMPGFGKPRSIRQ